MTTPTPCSITGLVELTPAMQLARATLDDLEKAGHGFSQLAREAAKAGNDMLKAFAEDAEDAVMQHSDALRRLVPSMDFWTRT